MTYRTSIDDIGWDRNVSIAFTVRTTGYSLRTVLELTHNNILYDGKCLLVGDILISDVPKYFDEYYRRCKVYFPNTELFFPTLQGRSLQPAKFSKQFKRLLCNAGISGIDSHPKKITPQQWLKLEQNRFSIQRMRYQAILAGTLCSFLGLRPSEVAKLKKSNIDLCGLSIALTETKSQKPQVVPILNFMINPLQQYLSHLEPRDPLFLRMSGKQWNRQDVCRAVSNYCQNLGIDGVTPQRLRPTLATELAKAGAPIALISALLRHRNIETSLRYYIHPEISDIRDFFEKMKDFSPQATLFEKPRKMTNYPNWFFEQDGEE